MQGMNNVDFIKKTMQIHEDIFRYQVRELHRLYSVQKILMEELKKEIKQKQTYWSLINGSVTDNSDKFINQHQHTFNLQNLTEDPSPSSAETIQVMAKGPYSDAIDDDHHQTRAKAASCSSCQPLTGNKTSNNGDSDEESEVELTLSIGSCRSNRKKMNKKLSANQPCLQEEEPLTEDSPASLIKGEEDYCNYSGPTTPMSSSSAAFDQERKHPHWLLQSLSINRIS